MKTLSKLKLSGRWVLPVIEGGKGIGVSNGVSAGAFAAAGGIGTFSGVNPEYYNEKGVKIPLIFKGKTRRERHEELISHGIAGGVSQAKIANDISGSNGRIHMNVLWEMGGAERVLHGVLEGAKGLIHGITCGAGMPYKLAEIAAKYKVHYYPIVSSGRAFRALWKRAYHKCRDLMGGVVYEDPWKAGGHNGLSNSEDPNNPQSPYARVVALRLEMNKIGNLEDVPIIMAGGVWHLQDWQDWIDNPEIGPIAFQFGTRPVVTQESPVPLSWKQKLLGLNQGDVSLNRFSPTGFYSSAVNNDFLQGLAQRSQRQVAFATTQDATYDVELAIGRRGRAVYIKQSDYDNVVAWMQSGFKDVMKTPDDTIIFVTPEDKREIVKDQVDCMGCLSQCLFSNWSQNPDTDYSTGKKADPRSFCIQKSLQNVFKDGSVNHDLLFAGHNAYKFRGDSLYENGKIPTVKQLIEKIKLGL